MVEALRKTFSLFLLSVFLLAGFGEQVHALVICFGADGHSAIEMESNGHCAERLSETGPEAGRRSGKEVSMQGENPDPCLDFCLSYSGESVRKTLLSGPAVPSLPTTGFRKIRGQELLAPKLSLSNIPPPYQTAAVLRSTILLI